MDSYDNESAQVGIGMALPMGASNSALDHIALNRRHRRQTTREQIEERIAGLESQITKHRRVLTILDANKGMEDALDALREIGV